MARSRRAAGIVALSVALAGAARAEGPVVTLVRPRVGHALAAGATTRLAAELAAAGFSVRIVEAGASGDGRAEVERVEGSFATIAIVPLGRGAAADVWIADRVTGKTVVRRVDVTDPTEATAASDLAVRSVELLRASLLEIRDRARGSAGVPEEVARFAGARTAPPVVPGPPPPPPPASPAPPVAPLPRPGTPRAAPAPTLPPAPAAGSGTGPATHVEIGAGVLASTEGGASVHPLIRVVFDLPVRLSLGVTVVPTGSAPTLGAAQGSVEFRQWIAALTLGYAFTPPEARVRPRVKLGGGVHGLRVDGSASAGYLSEHNEAASALVSLGAGLGVRLLEGVSAVADLDALVLLPGRTVSAVGAPLAHLGRPAFLPSLGLSASF